ncbi:MAG: hypothetical protein ACKVYV_14015 [Limisphaerales bacterium]
MKKKLKSAWLVSLTACALPLWTGCESSGGGGGSANVSGSMYYGVGFYDPWYYGGHSYYDDPDIIVTPPDRPEGGRPRPEHPIARPPEVAPKPTPRTSSRATPPASTRVAPSASPRPTPSMPSMPRGGGRRR